MRPTSIVLGLIAALVTGGGYAVSGNRDFTVEVQRPLPEVYSVFSGVRTFGSGLRNSGVDIPPIKLDRPSNNELIFTVPSSDPEKVVRIALTFTPGHDQISTMVSAAIDVPPIPMGKENGQTSYLSEDKIEQKFEQAISSLATQLNNHNSTLQGSNQFAFLLDMVALSSHPDRLAAVMRQADDERRKIENIKQNAEAEGVELTVYGDTWSKP